MLLVRGVGSGGPALRGTTTRRAQSYALAELGTAPQETPRETTPSQDETLSLSQTLTLGVRACGGVVRQGSAYPLLLVRGVGSGGPALRGTTTRRAQCNAGSDPWHRVP